MSHRSRGTRVFPRDTLEPQLGSFQPRRLFPSSKATLKQRLLVLVKRTIFSVIMSRKREINDIEEKTEPTMTKKRKVSKQSHNPRSEHEQHNASKKQKVPHEVDLLSWRVLEIVGGDVYYIPNVSLIIEPLGRSHVQLEFSPCVVCIHINSK